MVPASEKAAYWLLCGEHLVGQHSSLAVPEECFHHADGVEVAVVESPLESRQVAVGVFEGPEVADASVAALDDGPKGLDRVRRDGASDVLALGVID